jgi:hypothetical protein
MPQWAQAHHGPEHQESRVSATGGWTRSSKEQLIEFFERTIWPNVPSEALGKTLKKRDREEISATGRTVFEAA